MRKLIAPMLAAGLVLAFSLQPSTSAQSTPTLPMPQPTGADLDAKAQPFLAAVKSGRAEAVFAHLAPWRQNEANLYRARIIKAGRSGALKWDSLEKQIKRMDPQNKLNVASLEDYLALDAAQMFALAFGLYQAAADRRIADLLADEWFLVDRKIGLCEPYDSSGRDHLWRSVMETGGKVTLESVDGGTFAVSCVTDGREWFVVNAGFARVGDINMKVDWAMAALSDDMTRGRSPGTEERTSEGEQLLGSMKNRAKVGYAKMGAIPTNLTGNVNDGGAGVRESELDGKYHKCRDAVYSSGTMYALVGEPKDESDPWLLFMGDMQITAMDHIRHYDTKAEVDAAVELIKKGEIPPAKDEGDEPRRRK